MKEKLTARMPHDAIFRQFLTQTDMADDAMETTLAVELRLMCELTRLERAKTFVQELAQRVPDCEKALLTTVEHLEQLIFDKGFQLGFEIGLREGKKEAQIEIALAMLENGIDRNAVLKMTGLNESELAQIQH